MRPESATLGEAVAQTGRPWGWALLWGAVLGVLFFGTYNTVNGFTAQRSDVGVYVMDWEQYIPFMPWTIVPYWSIDLFYGIALFASRSKAELFRLGKRLLVAQAVCISGFLLWPLQFSYLRPPSDGVFGALFDALAGFDLPYNQAPSLHICLLVVLWRHYADLITQRYWRGVLHGWCVLIALSVLTTYQHHAIDLLTGFWAGALCLLAVPDGHARWRWRGGEQGTGSMRRWLAQYYLGGAVVMAALGVMLFPALWAWLLYWTAAALAGVAAIYLFGEATHFGKRNGRMPWRSWMFFGPYLIGAHINAWLWTRRLPRGGEVSEGVYLGRLPDYRALHDSAAHSVIDMCAELPLSVKVSGYHGLALLDLLPPDAAVLARAAASIEEARLRGPVWVCCALGMSRSAAAVVAWLIQWRGHTFDEAVARVRNVRPVVLSPAALHVLGSLPRGGGH